MKVKNINGTSDNKCKCISWLEHWKKFGGGTLPATCPEMKCIQKPEVGAHVQKENDNNWYIIPLCKTHNAMTGKSIDVVSSVKFVSANVSETCGK